MITKADKYCPKCGSKMAIRKYKGKLVKYCSDYPFCDYQANQRFETICNKCYKVNCTCEDEKNGFKTEIKNEEVKVKNDKATIKSRITTFVSKLRK